MFLLSTTTNHYPSWGRFAYTYKPFLKAASIVLLASSQGCPPQRIITRHGVDSLDAGALGGLGASEGGDEGVLSDHWRVPLGTKSALARLRNLFPAEKLAPGRAPGPGEDGAPKRRAVWKIIKNKKK